MGYPAAARILGLLLLGGYLFFAGRRRPRSQFAASFTGAVAAAAFGVGGIALLAQSLILTVRDQRAGVGNYLSAGIVSSIAAFASAGWLLMVRRRTHLSDVNRDSSP